MVELLEINHGFTERTERKGNLFYINGIIDKKQVSEYFER